MPTALPRKSAHRSLRVIFTESAMAIDRNEVGAHVTGTNVRFGVYLPGVRAADGFSVSVRVIHQDDQFVPEIPPISAALTFDTTHPLGLWSGAVDLATLPAPPGSHMGQN